MAEKGLPPLAEGCTKEGKYSFTDLSMGLYMVCSPSEEEAKELGDNARMTAFLVTLPLWTVDDMTHVSGWVYDVSTSSKFENIPSNPDGDNPGGNPPLENIDDVLVPLGLLPKTGDGSISYTPLHLLIMSEARGEP